VAYDGYSENCHVPLPEIPGVELPPPNAPLPELLSLPETTPEEMYAKSEALRRRLFAMAEPIFLEKFRSREVEFTPHDQPYTNAENDRVELARLRVIPGKGCFRAVLSRSEYPDLYRLYDSERQVQDRIERTEAGLLR
jgi:hypothetical protein